nr:hypothetical protein [uncultured Mediterranean phage uvMED]|tara:strand:+ start:170 stop:445 length:276 start_codon:yes stop_codon:yes gene_type:complete
MRKKKKLTGTIDDYKMVHVITHDWVSNSEWMSIPKAKKLEPAKCHSIGRLFNKTKTKIQLFGSWSIDEDGSIEIGTVETIPNSWVIEIKDL